MKTLTICRFLALIMMIMFHYSSCKTRSYPVIYLQLANVEDEHFNEDVIMLTMNSSKKMTIVLRNDSILEYNKVYGGIGSSTKIKYSLDDDFIVIDSLDIYGKSSPNQLHNAKIAFSLDSLVDERNGYIYMKQSK